ncbi:cupin domain-containing protein [Paenibacillus montanisoli]|uniref:Cupin domain-containing protein n=1 Tax=Paenibacillus montanisoli TaxID=2081970 RepID=A0A328U4R3_9BACL|nr:cupin domain-containing protein [Paenibacillus montanisoli]RAP77787.1 cupin domain-containing protein [Paenibacillus montanisoli]
MTVSYMDYTSRNVQFTYNVNNNTTFKKDALNYINTLSNQELNTLVDVSLLDIYMSKGNIVEPHYHQNAAELIYVISGSIVLSIINPFTNELLHFPLQPGQVGNVPHGWWHYEAATADNTHLLAIFDAPVPQFIGGSDLLRLTPADILAHTYCLNEAKVKDTLAPITQTVFIGPPANCNQPGAQAVQGVSEGVGSKQAVQGVSEGVGSKQAVQGVSEGVGSKQAVQGVSEGVGSKQAVQGVSEGVGSGYGFPNQKRQFIGNGWRF